MSAPTLRIEPGGLTRPEVHDLLAAHLADMHATSPAESVHALDLTGLQSPEVTFWTVWSDEELLGCGALKQLDAEHGEIKSMRTAPHARGMGVASRVLDHILTEAKSRGYERLSLETGTQAFFEPARRLYQRFGFVECPPFGDYRLDPNSVFMTRTV
jgi:putative acetyltransferase